MIQHVSFSLLLPSTPPVSIYVAALARIKRKRQHRSCKSLLFWVCCRIIPDVVMVTVGTWLCLLRPHFEETLPISSSDSPSEIIRMNTRACFEKALAPILTELSLLSYSTSSECQASGTLRVYGFFSRKNARDKESDRGGQLPRMRFAHISLVLLSAQLMFTAYWIIHTPLIWEGFNAVLLYQEDAGFL